MQGHTNDRECLRTPTNTWRSFCDHCDWCRIAFVSPFAIYSPLSGEFASNIFFYIRKDIRHSVRLALGIVSFCTSFGVLSSILVGYSFIKHIFTVIDDDDGEYYYYEYDDDVFVGISVSVIH